MEQPVSLIWQKSTEEDYCFLYEGIAVTMSDYLRATNAWSEEQIERHLQRMARRSWQLVLLEGKPVGGVTTGRTGDKLYLHGIFVLPTYQNRGLGTTMLRELIEWAAHRHLVLSLHVFFGNERARTLYERFGFHIVGAGETSYIMELPPAIPAVKSSLVGRFWDYLRVRLSPQH